MISYKEGLYLATLGGARALNIEVGGKEREGVWREVARRDDPSPFLYPLHPLPAPSIPWSLLTAPSGDV